ncbi:MAG: NHL repeat-containing protein [Pirellula sp.]
MQYPLAVVVGPTGIVFVADRNLPGIWKIENGTPTIFFQGSKKFRTPLNAVRCLAMDNQGTLYAGDSATREIYRFDEKGNPHPLTQGAIGIPMSIAIDRQGNLLVADLERHCIFQVPGNGGAVTEFVKTPAPRGIAVDSQDRVWVLSNSKHPLLRFGEKRTSEVIVGEPLFEFAHQIVLDPQGNAYLCDGYAKSVWKIPLEGKPIKIWSGEPLKNPVGLAIDRDRLLIADPHQKMIYAWAMGSPVSADLPRSLEAIVKQ